MGERQPAFAGDAIIVLRRRMSVGLVDLASVLDISRATLYRWEADGYFQHRHHPGARILSWLLTLGDTELEPIAKDIRSHQLRGVELRDRIWLLSLSGKKRSA